MRVVILGPGGIGSTLAQFLSTAGHEMMLSAYRDEDKAWSLADAIGARIGDLGMARQFGEVFFLAVPHAVASQTLQELNPTGGLVVDCTNQFGGEVPGGFRTTSEYLATFCPAAVVAKAFNTLRVDDLRARSCSEPGIALPYCCDSSAASRLCEALVRDCGYQPVNLGPLASSGLMQPGGPFFLQVLTADEALSKAAPFVSGATAPTVAPS